MNELINASCPYATWEPSTLVWCEQQLCSYIREPANTWSNLGYILVGLWMFRKTANTGYRHLHLFGYFAIFVGLMSAFYHATGSFIGEALDYSSMFLISTFFICMALARRRSWTYQKLRFFAFCILVPSIALLIKFKIVGAFIFGLQVAAAVIIESQLWKESNKEARYRYLLYAIICFLTAYGIWTLDKERIVCSPTTHWISGHAIWHFLSAASIFNMYRFYRQFTLTELPGHKII